MMSASLCYTLQRKVLIMVRLTKFSLVIALLLTSVLFLNTTPASAQGGTPDNPTLSVSGCTLTVTFTASQGEIPASASGVRSAGISQASITYTLQLWDDGSIIDSDTVSVAPGSPVSLSVTVTSAIGTGVPGVGIQLREDGSLVYDNDPYLGLDGPCKAAQTGCNVKEGSYQGLLTQSAQLFWAASDDKSVTPVTFIPAGQVVTIIDASTAGWYKITWACGTYYIKIDGVVGNPAKITKPYLPGTPRTNAG
jgi:hypothetical protein